MTDQGNELAPGNESLEKEYPRVDMGRGRLGMEITGEGNSFSLSNIFGKDADFLGGDRFTGVYLETKSGNIYWIRENDEDFTGEIINANESRRAHGRLHVTPLDREDLAGRKITIGSPFAYGRGSTSDVMKISVINDKRIYGQESLDQITEGRKSAITTDFKAACLPKGAETQK